VGGRGFGLGAEKPKARKMLENGAESHQSAARFVGQFLTLERDQKLTSRIEPIQEHCDRTKIKKGFA
jgi:hypothetical protein